MIIDNYSGAIVENTMCDIVRAQYYHHTTPPPQDVVLNTDAIGQAQFPNPLWPRGHMRGWEGGGDNNRI